MAHDGICVRDQIIEMDNDDTIAPLILLAANRGSRTTPEVTRLLEVADFCAVAEPFNRGVPAQRRSDDADQIAIGIRGPEVMHVVFIDNHLGHKARNERDWAAQWASADRRQAKQSPTADGRPKRKQFGRSANVLNAIIGNPAIDLWMVIDTLDAKARISDCLGKLMLRESIGAS